MNGISRKISNIVVVCVFAFLTGSGPSKAIVDVVATGVVLNELRKGAEGLINKGRDAGDFLIWRLGIQLKDTIDAWERANSNLLKDAFGKLDQLSQNTLRSFEANIDKITNEKNVTVEQAEKLTSDWAQIISTTVLASSDPYIMNYSPRVLTPEGEQTIRLRITGPNISRAEPKLGSESNLKADLPSVHEANFQLKRDNFSFPEEQSDFLSYEIKYRTSLSTWYNPLSWFNTATSSNNVVFWLLPKRLAKYEVSTRVENEKRDVDTRVVNLGKFQGRNSRIPRAVAAPDSALGWRIDLTRRKEIRLVPGGGDKGRCEGIEDNSITENGLTMFAHVDDRDNWTGTHDAWVDCSISLPIYRIRKVEEDGPTAQGALTWSKDESFRLPPNLRSIRIDITTFDKRGRVMTGAGSDKFFDVRMEGGLLIFRPRAPRDF